MKKIQQQQIPKNEYPRPDFVRDDWVCLNGKWSYDFDFSKSGKDRGLCNLKGFLEEITVPYCPESKLSGVEFVDFIDAMWYHREIFIPSQWINKRVILHFGAVDYNCELYIDGELVGSHFGGSSSFDFDITDFVSFGKTHDLVLYVEDDVRDDTHPSGKQSVEYKSRVCHYTRVTGIWQTVWMEAVDPNALKSCRIVPDIDNSKVLFIPKFYADCPDVSLTVKLFCSNKLIAIDTVIASNEASITVELDEMKLWCPEDPFLYDVEYEVYCQDILVDRVSSYCGLRKVHVEHDKFFLNNKPFFQRLVLDQGYYPDGIWTSPTDEDLKNDIQLGLDAGFNGARAHQKMFEPRYLYWADKMGYVLWAESASWGCNINKPESYRNFASEWTETVKRDINHPSIIVWSPFNETSRGSQKGDSVVHDRTLVDIYNLTNALDGTRPVNDTSGYYHVKTDIWSVHLYGEDAMGKLVREKPVYIAKPEFEEKAYKSQPYILSEFGGIKWSQQQAQLDEARKVSWGYGDAPKTKEEFYDKLQAIVDVVLAVPNLCGYCYTQLTDVEQEQNGIYDYHRKQKFDIKRINEIFSKDPYKQDSKSITDVEQIIQV